MDFTNERYVRLYTRETTTWRLLGWQGQALLPQVLRMVDRSGVLDLSGQDLFSAVYAHLPGWPADVVGDGIVALVSRGVIVHRDGQLVWPRYLEAQECAMSDAQRARDSRERRRSGGNDVTKREELSQSVTARHSSRALPSVPSVPSEVLAAEAAPKPVGAAGVAKPVEANDEPPEAREAKRKRRTQLPADFGPDETRQRLAVELGVDLAVEVATFREYHEARGNVMADWNLALATWLRNAAKFEARRGRGPGRMAGTNRPAKPNRPLLNDLENPPEAGE